MGTSEVHAGGGGDPAIDLHPVPMGKRQYPCHFNLGILGKRPCEAGMQKHCQEYFQTGILSNVSRNSKPSNHSRRKFRAKLITRRGENFKLLVFSYLVFLELFANRRLT